MSAALDRATLAQRGPIVGVGTDAVDVTRFERVLSRRIGIKSRIFTEGELEYAASAKPGPSRSARLAVRFAAKEAVLKAMSVGIGAADLRDIEVHRHRDGMPTVALSGRAAELAGRLNVAHWHLSLTHTDTLALAFAVAEGS